ncbi:MAG: hypothetical protein LC627_00115, partial [Verrucomicrobiaceae bacterium]|nr:hypothetical protein [Verrucomicrobiaceae bacterium]
AVLAFALSVSGTFERLAVLSNVAVLLMYLLCCGACWFLVQRDVRVTRRVYRDGNSEYLLNKTVCRLRDIQALFADTGVGRSAYSIMEQGKIDLILSSRPEDRRAVFEEAAGITKYKTQKKEALRKLEATEANLLRIGDIIKEVKRQIGSLQRQAGKARRYQTLLADLQVLDTHHSRRQLDELEAEAARGREQVSELQAAEKTAHAKIETSEDELTAKRRSLDDIDTEIANARAEVQRLHSEMAGLRNRIEFNRQRAQELGELIERYENDIAGAEAKRSEQASELQEADALIARTNQLLETKEGEVEQLTETVRLARTKRGQSEDELQALQISLSKLENRIATFENELSGMTARRDATSERISELARLINEETLRVEKARANLAAARAAVETQRQTAEQLKENLRQAGERSQQSQAAVAKAEKEIARVDRLIAEKQARLEVLRQMTEEGEGLEKGSQAVLKGLDDPDRIRPAIAGALVASLNVDAEFIPALEAAFGRSMHAVVLHNTGLASEIFRSLTEKELGLAALAIPELSANLADTPSSKLPEGALGWAIDKIDVPENMKALVSHLLRDVAIVPDLALALSLKKRSPRLQFATLNGEFISSSGIIFGGSAKTASDSLLGRKAVLTNLARECELLEADRDNSISARDKANAELESAIAAMEEARLAHENAHQNQSRSGIEILASERAAADIEHKLSNLQNEKGTLEQQIQSAAARIDQLSAELDSNRKNFEEERSRKTAAEEARENARSEEEEASEKLGELRLAVATERQRHESLVHHREPMAAREAELADLVAARRNDIATYQKRLAQQAQESKEAEAKISEQAAELETAEKRVATLTEQRGARSGTVNEQESQLRGLRNSLNDLRDLRGKQEVRQTQLQLRIENLVEHVTRRYQVDLRAFTADAFAFQKTLSVVTRRRGPMEGGAPATPSEHAGSEPEGSQELAPPAAEQVEGETNLEQLIAELTRQLDNMGPVNLDAVHEYDELEERYQFLETQNNDLISSRREVLDVITRINSTTQKLFAETFAQVRLNFGEMFAEM